MATSTDADVLEVVIDSEAAAWEALRKASSEGFPDAVRLRFRGWPVFSIDYKGRDWHSTVPTRVMPSLLDVQKDINRAFAHMQYGELNLRRLREEDRDELEVVVKVKKGSSAFDADLWLQFTKMAEAAVGRMTGTEIAITVISAALVLVSPVMFKAWLKSRQDAKELDTRVQLSKEETERLKVFASGARQVPAVSSIKDEAEATNNALLKATRPGDTVTIGSTEVSAEVAQRVVQSEREQSRSIEMSGAFAVLGNRTDKGMGFRISVRDHHTGEIVNADVGKNLPWEQKELIRDAEWTKSLVMLVIHADRLGESIVRAEVISARAYRPAKISE